MDAKERNRLFERHWPFLKNVVFGIWSKYRTVRRIGEIDDVLNDAALAVLSGLDNFTPASKYDSEDQRDNHILSYLSAAIHRTLTYRSRCASLLHVPAHVAASVFSGDNTDARPAVHCKQFDPMPVVMAEAATGTEDHTVQELQTAIKRLQPAERDIITKFWGLAGERVGLRELSVEYGLTRNATRRRVRAIESKLKLMMNRE